MSESSNKKESSNDLKNESNENYIKNKIILNEFPDAFSINKRFDKDPETKDIEHFLEKLSDRHPKKINNNLNMNYISIKKQKQIKNSIRDNKNNKFQKVKFRMAHLKLKNEYKNDNKEDTRNLANFKLKNKLIKGHNANNTPKNNRVSSVLFNLKEPSLKLNNRKLNIQNYDKTTINSPSFNIISSINVNDTNHINPNLSSSFKINNKNNKSIIFSKKNNSFSINHQINKLNNNIAINFDKHVKNNNENTINTFKETERFIKDSIDYKNKVTLKRNIILKNFSTFFNKNIPNNNSKYYELGLSNSNRYFSNSPNNSFKKMRELFKKTDFEKLVFQINKRLIISRQKESKSYTFKQILKNCEIYTSKLN